MKLWKQYIFLETKRMIKGLPAICLGSLFLIALLAGIFTLFQLNSNRTKEGSPVEIGVVAKKDEPFVDWMITTISNIENTKYMLHLPNNNIEETKEFLQRSDAEWKSAAPSFYEFAIIYQDKHIGAASIYLEDGLSGELGWIINKKYQKQGFAFEAARALMDFSINELKVKHFIAHCDAENIPSYKVMEKLGMSRTGEWSGRRNKSASKDSLEYQYELYL